MSSNQHDDTDALLLARCADDVLLRNWRAIDSITDADWNSVTDGLMTVKLDAVVPITVDRSHVVRVLSFRLTCLPKGATELKRTILVRIDELLTDKLGNLSYNYIVSIDSYANGFCVTIKYFKAL